VSAKVSIVIIDDNKSVLEFLADALSAEDVRILAAADPEDGLDLVFQEHPQIVLTDLMMPGLTGLQVLDRIIEFDPAIDVILMTAFWTTESAVAAIRNGAADYLEKPVRVAVLRERIKKLVDEARRQNRGDALERQLLESATFEGMVGSSAALWETASRIRRVARHYRTALITGETGTGKELAARALHNLSPVSKGRFVVLNCSAVVESLFESELFGHVKGSFTGAEKDKMGLFEFADGGTIFLDEIGDMPVGTQAKLLRTLQNQEVLRVGSLTPRKVDVHVVAATHRNLHAAITEKQFREDLYYRLSMIEIRVPSLAERKEDLPLLTRYFVEKFSTQFRKEIRGLTQRAQIVLARHNWPGNIRELENAVGHGCMMALGETIDLQDLPEYLWASARNSARLFDLSEENAISFEDHEKRLIIDALEQAKWNQSVAARTLRIGRDALRYKMKKHGLDTPQSGNAAAS